MDFLFLLVVVLVSLLAGVVITLALQWYFFNRFVSSIPCVGPPNKPVLSQFRLPKSLVDTLQSTDIPKKESCLALNLLFQFLFKELRNAQKVRRWFRQKLSLEFEELLTRTTTGKLFDCVSIRDICLGTQFPTIKSVSAKNIVVHPQYQHIETLDICMDIEYSGGFQLSIDANMVLGKAAYLSVKVNHLSGLARLQFTRHPYTHWSFSFYNDPVLELQVESQFQGRPLPQITSIIINQKRQIAPLCVLVNHLSGLARLQFTRHPYTHWSFSFYNDPVLELQVESQFQGRPLPQITSIIINQIRKTLKKKHTLPNYKLRYKPFFPKSEPGEEVEETNPQCLCYGTLQVTILEVTRLMESLIVGDIYCSLAVDSTAWVEMIQSENQSFITLDVTIHKTPAQNLGIVFKQEFVAERYQACVLVETVLPQSPALAADIRRSDIIVAVDGKRITSMAQAAKVIKNAGDKFTIRVERKLNYRVQQNDISEEKENMGQETENVNSEGDGKLPGSPVITHSGLRQRRGSGDKTESDSSSSSPASLPSSPAKRPSLFSRSSHSSPEHKHKTQCSNKHKDSKSPVNKDEGMDVSSENYLQICKTKELPPDQILMFDETLNFQLHENHRYLNISVWSKSEGNESVGSLKQPKADFGRDVLLGHISIPLSSITSECSNTKLGHHIKSFFLLPPEPNVATRHPQGNVDWLELCCFHGSCFSGVETSVGGFTRLNNEFSSDGISKFISRNHKLSSYSGFEPCLCYGDILLSFLFSGHTTVVPPPRPNLSPVKIAPPQLLLPRPSPSTPDLQQQKQHNFIRTHFHRTTQCEFCGKKIWLKDAVQCCDCAMTCHKKCVAKCQVGTVCIPGGSQRRASALPEDTGAQTRSPELAVPPTQIRRASAQPEIITTSPDDNDVAPQGQQRNRGIGSLLATVANAANQARSLKRVGSANNLAPPNTTSSSILSRSLPPSPQHSPAGSRKASLVETKPFQFPHSLLDDEAGDDVSAALDHLLQHPNDDDLMSIAKSTGKELYSSLSPPERKNKINKMISKLKAAIDEETQLRMELARKEQESKDPSEHTKIAFLIGKSDEKVQALAVLMLHFCAGLQHTQDQEESAASRKDDQSPAEESITSDPA